MIVHGPESREILANFPCERVYPASPALRTQESWTPPQVIWWLDEPYNTHVAGLCFLFECWVCTNTRMRHKTDPTGTTAWVYELFMPTSHAPRQPALVYVGNHRVTS